MLGMLGGVLLPRGWSAPVQAAPAAQEEVDHIVISKFRARGPAGGHDEFLELYNPKENSEDISGWEIWSCPSGGAEGIVAIIPGDTTNKTMLPRHQHYLIVNEDFSDSVVYDLMYPSSGFADEGGIALVDPDEPDPVDQVGTSNASACKEGAALAPLAGNRDRAYERLPGGVKGNGTDTDDNASDFVLISPSFSDVVINEVAWMGTAAWPTDEWIELYNFGREISLDGWRLEAADGDPSIPFTAEDSIPAGGYLLLERGDDNVVSDINLPNDSSDKVNVKIYNSGEMSDAGETLYLLNPSRAVIDTVNDDGGPWPAGLLSNFGSMERRRNPDNISDAAWITNTGERANGLDAKGERIRGTPGDMNWAYEVTPTPSPTPTASKTPSPTATTISQMTIVINEVAWAGTRAANEDEWIELYNPNPNPVNLAGWRLFGSDGTPFFTLSKTIPGKGYFLLERDDDKNVADIPADLIYTGSLSNDGEVLRLIAPNGTIVDTANNDNTLAWNGGAASGYYPSMERRTKMADGPASWITNTGAVKNGKDRLGNSIYGTPRQPNWALSITPTASRTPTITPTRTVTRTPTRPPNLTPTPIPRVVINEFVPRAGHDWNNDGKVDVYDEYIEIYNVGVTNVNIAGWKLDDESNQGSNPYSLPGQTLKPGDRVVYYASTTGISLSDGGDTVRLLKSNGQVSDAYTYGVVKYADQTWCRQPDGFIQWSDACYPSPGNPNTTGATPTPIVYKPWEEKPAPACLMPDTVPDFIAQAECGAPGMNIWRLTYWDRLEGEIWLYTSSARQPAIFR